MQVNVHQAKTQLSRLLQLVEDGETVVIAGHGQPVAQLVQVIKEPGIPFGIAIETPLVPPGDAWWQPLSDKESEDWIDGR